MKEHTDMEKQRLTVNHHLGALAEDAHALLVATADMGGDKVTEARQRLAAALDNGKEVFSQVRDKAITSAKAADRSVRQNPYPAIGAALAVGTVIGFLIARD